MNPTNLPSIGGWQHDAASEMDGTYKTKPKEVKVKSARIKARSPYVQEFDPEQNQETQSRTVVQPAFGGTKEDYLKMITELERKEAELIECQKAYETAARENARRVKKAERKQEKALVKYEECHQHCVEAEEEVTRLSSLMDEVQMLIEIFDDSIAKQKPYRECIKLASIKLNDIEDPEVLISRYEATEAKRGETLRKFDEMMDAKTRHLNESQEIVYQKKQQIAQLRDHAVELTKQLQMQNGEVSERKQQQQQLEQQLVKQKIINGELYAAIDNIFKSIKAPKHYFDKTESEDILRLLNGTLQHVPLVKELVDEEKEQEKIKSLSGAIGAPSRLPPIPSPTNANHRQVAVAHKIVDTARRLHLIASVLETQEAIAMKFNSLE